MVEYIREKLFEMRDENYRDFNSKLIPTINKKTIIGVRTPKLRKLAKELITHTDIDEFLNSLPHTYYEENNLHAFLIEQIDDYNDCIREVNRFLPYIDNWATCDSLSPKVFKKEPKRMLCNIKFWISSEDTYVVRFGIGMLMRFFLNENFSLEYLKIVSKIKSDEYYINMMIAWYFATALAKQYDSTIPYLESRCLSDWVHNKTIQKAKESLRISKKQKEYLNTLKI